MTKKSVNNYQQKVVLYQEEDSNVVVSVAYKDETFWLTQNS